MSRPEVFVVGLGVGSLVPAAAGVLASWWLRRYLG